MTTKPVEAPKIVKPVTAPPKAADKPAKAEEKKVAILPAKFVKPAPHVAAAHPAQVAPIAAPKVMKGKKKNEEEVS